MNRRADGLVVAMLGLLAALCLAPVVFAGRLLAVGDGLAQDFPLRVLAASAWRHGEWPFWNPYGFAGMPLLATMHVGTLCPLNLPFLWLPPALAMAATVWLAFTVAGGGAFALGRAIGLSRASAAVSGLVYMGAGFLVAHIENLQMLQAAALAPWVVWAIARAATPGARAAGPVLAGVVALQFLAGHPQMSILTGLVGAAYALCRAGALASAARRPFLRVLAGAALLALGLVAIQLLPALAFIPTTQRSAIPYETLVFRALPPRQLLSLAFPFLFGAEPSALFPTAYWGAPHRIELSGYAGLATLVLAGLAWLRRRQAGLLGAETVFWSGVAVVGIILAMGGHTPLYRLWGSLPVLNALTAPGRHLLEVDLALAMLAGLGAEAWRRSPALAPGLAAWGLVGLPVLGVLGGVAAFGQAFALRAQPFLPPGLSLEALLTPAAPAIWLPVLLWLLCGALLAAGGRRPAFAPPPVFFTLLLFDLGLFATHAGWRQLAPLAPEPLMVVAPLAGEARLYPVSSQYVYPYYDLGNVRSLDYPNWGALARMRTVTGYDAFLPGRLSRLLGGMASTGLMATHEPWEARHHALDLLGLAELRLDAVSAGQPFWRGVVRDGRWVAGPGADPLSGLALPAPPSGLAGTFPPTMGEGTNRSQQSFPFPTGGGEGARRADGGAVVTYHNTHALPRAWRVKQAASLPEPAVDAAVRGETPFDPHIEALLDAPTQAPEHLTAGPAQAHADGLNAITLSTDGPGPGLVVISESYDPGWRAFEGEREYPVHRVDGLVMGAEVPPGPHTLTLRYTPPLFPLGAALSTLSLLLLGLWASLARRREDA